MTNENAVANSGTGTEQCSDFSPEFQQREDGYTTADCGEIEVAGPVGNMFAAPDSAEIEIEANHAPGDEDSEEKYVMVSIRTDRAECSINLRCILSPGEAHDLAERLTAAGEVAAGERTR